MSEQIMRCWNSFEPFDEDTSFSSGLTGKASLYDIKSLGKIVATEPVTTASISLVQSENDNIALSVDGALTILLNGDHMSGDTINFGEKIETLCFRGDGEMIMVGDASGTFHIVSVTTKKVILSHKVAEPGDGCDTGSGKYSRKCFCAILCSKDEENQGVYHIALGLVASKIIIFSNVQLHALEEAHRNSNFQVMKQIQASMRTMELDISFVHGQIMTDLTGSCHERRFISAGGGVLALWGDSYDPFVLDSSASLTLLARSLPDMISSGKKAEITKIVEFNGYIFTLLDEGSLCLWSDSPLSLCQFWQKLGIQDFLIVDSYVDGAESSLKICAVVANEENQMEICFLQGPFMSVTFKHACSGQSICRLASGALSPDGFVYVDVNFQKMAGSLRLNRISEASPEDRFMRLLNKRQFDEAEQFAKMFNLNMKQFHHQKAIYLANTLMDTCDQEDSSALFKELICCLEKMEDDDVIAQICLHTTLPDIRMSYTVLALAKSRLSEKVQLTNGDPVMSSSNTARNASLLQIIDQLDRLVTFRVAYGYGQQDGADWIRFCKANLAKELVTLLDDGNLSAAATILQRHKSSLLALFEEADQDSSISGMNEKHLRAFLEHIPNSPDVEIIVKWLEISLLPVLLPRVQCSVKVLASWLHVRAESYENSHPSDWPANGLKMANVLFNYQKDISGPKFVSDQLIAASPELKSTSIEVAKLRLLVTRLQNLQKLKQKYDCKVSLAEFVEETTKSLTYRMLDRVMAPELIPVILQKTVRPYMEEHDLTEEDVLLGYVDDVLSRFKDEAQASTESLRERKIQAIIACMNKPQVCIQAIGKLAKWASVPWSEDMHSLIERGIKTAKSEIANNDSVDAEIVAKSSAILKDLEYCKSAEKLPSLVAEYGFTNVQLIRKPVQQQMIRFLIRQDTEDALRRADIFCRTLTTISRLEFHRYRLLDLLHTGKFGRCLDLLIEVEKESKQLATGIVHHMLMLTELHLEDNDAESRADYCRAAISMVEHILPRLESSYDAEFTEKLCMLRNIVALQVKCGVRVSMNEYVDEDYRMLLLSKKVEEYCASSRVRMGPNETESAMSFDASIAGLSLHGVEYHSSVNQSRTTTESSSKEDESTTSIISMSHLLNLASILGIPGDRVRVAVARVSARSSKSGLSVSIRMCRELLQISPTEETANASIDIAKEAFNQLDATTCSMGMITEILSIAVEAIMFCKSDKISDGIEMCKFYELAQLFNKIADNRQGIFAPHDGSAEKDQYENVKTLYEWMEDSGGLVIQETQVAPIFSKITRLLFKNGGILSSDVCDPGSFEVHLVEWRELVFELTSVLQYAKRPHLALSWTVTCVSLALRCLANRCSAWNEADGERFLSAIIGTIEEVGQVMPNYVNDCINKVLRARVIDVSLLVGLLTLVPISEARSLLQSELNKSADNSKRIMSIARAGIEMLQLNSMQSEVARFEHLFLDAHWGELLKSLKIHFDRDYFSSEAGKSITLSELLHHPNSTGKLVKEFCLDYGLDVTSALLDFMRVMLADSRCVLSARSNRILSEGDGALLSLNAIQLSHMNMHFVAWENQDSKRKEIGKKTSSSRPWESIKKEMVFVMENVSDKSDVCRNLIHILRSETSPYFYERAKFILNQIEQCKHVQSEVDVPKGLQLISCLSLVKRTSPVGEYERQFWSMPGVSQATSKLPDIANEKLPLHPLLFGDSTSAWKILTPELNELTATRLEPICQILSLNVDKLYITAADNFIQALLDKSNTGQLSIDENQLRMVQKLVSQVQDCRLSTAVAKKIADLLPISGQKVEAYKWATSIAEHWRTTITDQDMQDLVLGTHQKLKNLYYDASMQHILLKYGLLSENTAMLTSFPEKLICFLYKHPSIIKRYYEPDDAVYPDIHAATSAIADFHSLNIFKIRLTLSKDLLLATARSNQAKAEDDALNVTNAAMEGLVKPELEATSSVSSEFIKVLYVLSHMDMRRTAQVLLRFTFDKKNPRITHAVRAQAFRCCLQLFDDDVMEELTKQSVTFLRKKFRLLVYLSEFESIGFEIGGGELENSKKDEVARSIYAIPKFRHNPRAICVAAELCREFHSWCPKTWQLLLQQMVLLRQISYLRHLLPDICCQPSVSSLPCLATVWQSCVVFPLTTMTPPLRKEETKAAIASYNFLLACPVLLEMDLVSITKQFYAIDFPLLALGCLLIDPSQDDSAKKLVAGNFEAIQRQLKEHSNIPGNRQINEVMATFNASA